MDEDKDDDDDDDDDEEEVEDEEDEDEEEDDDDELDDDDKVEEDEDELLLLLLLLLDLIFLFRLSILYSKQIENKLIFLFKKTFSFLPLKETRSLDDNTVNTTSANRRIHSSQSSAAN